MFLTLEPGQLCDYVDSMDTTIRQTAVAGSFYPADPIELQQMINGFMQNTAPLNSDAVVPRAIVAPHAGYIYSGPIAASAYSRIIPAHSEFTRVVLLGPSHRVALRGLAASSASQFATPLGLIPLDTKEIDRLVKLPQVHIMDTAHLYEHSLEVHLPFLQTVLDKFSLVPLLVGDADPEEVAQVLKPFLDDPHTLIVISSDLSHYLDYHSAQQRDAATSRAIEKLEPQAIGYEDACGRNPLNGMLTLAKQRNLRAELIDLRNSGDTAGTHDQVVGYGAYIIH